MLLLHRAAAGRFENTFQGCRKPGQLGNGSTRASDEFTAAVWALPAKHLICARLAERALERADASLGGFGRKVAVAAFAIRT